MTTQCGTTTTAALLIGAAEPPVAVIYEPDEPGEDSTVDFFSVLFADAPPPPADDAYRDAGLTCAHCLIENHPDVGRGLDLAKQLGDAEGELVAVERDLDTGEWRRADDTGESVVREAHRRRRHGLPIA